MPTTPTAPATHAEYHCVMTIQSMWNREPSAAVTLSTVLDAVDYTTAQELYDLMYDHTLRQWHRENSGTSMGKPMVVFWSFAPNVLPTL